MLTLRLDVQAERPLRLLALGAHPDDIEIGAGGALLVLGETMPLDVRYLVMTGTCERRTEARHAAESFLPDADLAIELHELPEGRLPAVWDEVKQVLEDVAASWAPDLILSPAADDAHQDHRTLGEIVPTVFRDSLWFAYEVPKWDGDLRRPGTYIPLSRDVVSRKVELLHKCFPSQRNRDWWTDDVFFGLARLRGVECREPYAEGFTCTKSTILPVSARH